MLLRPGSAYKVLYMFFFTGEEFVSKTDQAYYVSFVSDKRVIPYTN